MLTAAHHLPRQDLPYKDVGADSFERSSKAQRATSGDYAQQPPAARFIRTPL
ncbi:hypothetical protein HV824_29695 [Myxococcus sp. AM009]|uniref:hypothetical protein n=1 Tax=unclassified Myxococcus TaxID=2648731 RepID=UPI00159561CE|nr:MULTISPECIES: hypothetical protein [unclassified Myxococcus]NVJ02268.1 hypothetical protein [Myxococcus sp. AM009]NVJ19060.1 hypothetical protein [Myxococcus sp. AM010]